MLIGVLYVLFEKNFAGSGALSNSQSKSAGTKVNQAATEEAEKKSSLINLPTSEATPAPISGTTDLLQEAQGLEMRDYSTYFEELKDTVNN